MWYKSNNIYIRGLKWKCVKGGMEAMHPSSTGSYNANSSANIKSLSVSICQRVPEQTWTEPMRTHRGGSVCMKIPHIYIYTHSWDQSFSSNECVCVCWWLRQIEEETPTWHKWEGRRGCFLSVPSLTFWGNLDASVTRARHNSLPYGTGWHRKVERMRQTIRERGKRQQRVKGEDRLVELQGKSGQWVTLQINLYIGNSFTEVYLVNMSTAFLTFSVSVSHTFMVLSKELETNMPVS